MTETGAGAKYDKLSLLLLTVLFLASKFPSRPLIQVTKLVSQLGYLKRNTGFILRTEVRQTLYLALVGPHLAYATQIWALQSIEVIVKFERIQRHPTKFILKLPYSSNISYKSRLQTLNLILICYRHALLDITFFFQTDTRCC